MTVGLDLGAPGVYRAPPREPDPGFSAVRLDVTGFAGVALRGPVGEAVPVTSWSQFLDIFGGPTDAAGVPCPGFLPRAVQAFFAQGGAKAWIVRVAPVTPDLTASARFVLPGLLAAEDVSLLAASEGRWGDRLQITVHFETALLLPAGATADVPGGSPAGELALPDQARLPAGSLLLAGGSARAPAGDLHWVREVSVRSTSAGRRQRSASIDPPLAPAERGRPVFVVTAGLEVFDTDPLVRRGETITGLGLHPDHPRFLPYVLPAVPEPAGLQPGSLPGDPAPPRESMLLRAGGGWDGPVTPPPGLSPFTAVLSRGGTDRFSAITGESFFDDGAADSDPLDEIAGHRGADLLGRVEELGLLCVPDLSWDWRAPLPLPPEPAVTATGGSFSSCEPVAAPLEYEQSITPTSHLDPRIPDDLAEIITRQRRLVDIAVLRRRFVGLLDAPSGLALAELIAWRSTFDTSYAAAYHPWLGVPGPGPAAAAVLVPPSAVAAGVIGARERRLGLPWGPANELAVSAVTGADVVTDATHDQLHLAGINVFRAERDGFRLTAARTLARDSAYRQLSVRRLMTMISLSVERQSQWLVFEPNTLNLRAKLFHSLSEFLAQLFRAGAFAGDTAEQSFFVRCDEALNPVESQGQGRLVAEIGVAPAAPLEYLVLRLTQDADTGVQVVAEG